MSTTTKFPKKERLCGEVRIGKLFAEGNAFIAYPLRVVYKLTDEKSDAVVKVLMSVPKKKIRKAVHRNKIKRLMREGYRLNKSSLLEDCQHKSRTLYIAFTYLSDKETCFEEIEEKIKYSIKRIIQQLDR